jgi:hypothetical protein
MSQANRVFPCDDPLACLADLKGAPLACLVALRLAARPLEASTLERLTGYSAGEVRDGLEFLWVFGFVERLPQGALKLAGFPGSDRLGADP